MSAPLDAVRHAAEQRNESTEEYLQAIRAAREAGHTFAAIGDAAGLTKQGVRYLLTPDPRKEGKT